MTLFDKEKEMHPSYGMISISRASAGGGGIPLFGSAMRHGNFFILKVKKGSRRHDLSQDWYSTEGLPYIEVLLSPSQFVSMITTMNIGTGVPCTIGAIDGKQVEPCPPQAAETERIRTLFKENMQSLASELADMITKADAILDKKSLNKDDKGFLRGAVRRVQQFFNSNSGFAADQFNKATDKMTAQAKAEVEDFIMTAIQRAGLKAIAEAGGDLSILQLPEGESNEG